MPNLWWIDTRNVDITGLCWDLAPTCDTGGASTPWILSHAADIHWLPSHRSSGCWKADDLPTHLKNTAGLRAFLEADPRNQNGTFWAEIYADCLLHLRAGSNWNGEGAAIHQKVAELVAKYLS